MLIQDVDINEMDDGYRSARYAMRARVIAILLCIASRLFSGTPALAEQVQVVTSNTAFADIARQIGGAAVVVSVVDSPRVAASSVRPKSIVLCGWARTDAPLRDAARRASPNATLIELPRPAPEVPVSIDLPWYDTASMSELARTYADQLMRIQPSLALQFAGNLIRMRAGLGTIDRRVKEIARDYANSEVIAADPLSRAVATKLGFEAVGRAAAGEISAKSADDLKKSLEEREGSIFLYESDAANADIKNLVAVANRNGIPVVALQDKLPARLRYQQWVLRQWNAVHGALNEASP
jgi:zinc/manganese transport system substrate-binding protein